MHYRAVGKVICPDCHNASVIDTDGSEPGFIDAKSEAEAAERFRLIHRLCPICLRTGTPVAVEFDGYIHVESLPGFQVK
jgi:hypothetical protein